MAQTQVAPEKPETAAPLLVIPFDFERETKNTYRYAERVADGGEPIIQTLYVKKVALNGKAPSALSVTVAAA